jgi:protein-tyrosine-phosphatase
MAEIIMKDYLSRMDLISDWEVQSAGTWAEPGFPATAFGIKAMAERGLDTSSHSSQAVTKQLLDQFDLILTMETGHKEAIQVEFPGVNHKVFLLSEMAGVIANIDDPVGGTLVDYLNTANEIDEWIQQGIPKILSILNFPD